MKQHPILFSTPMVQAILEGRKTQTRRIVKPQPSFDQVHVHKGKTIYDGENRRWFYKGHYLGDVDCNSDLFGETLMQLCPYGEIGDVLWVRESGRWMEAEWDYSLSALNPVYPANVEFKADGGTGPWKPPIHMPKWACRLFLEITGIRVERLQDISDYDCHAEGVSHPEILKLNTDGTARGCYRDLWQSINGPESWDANPWVRVVKFKKIDKP